MVTLAIAAKFSLDCIAEVRKSTRWIVLSVRIGASGNSVQRASKCLFLTGWEDSKTTSVVIELC